jgi:hypothetical protein
MKLTRLSGSSTASENETLTFEIPVQAVNLARSYMTIDYKITGEGAAKAMWAFRNTVPFSSMQLFTRGGQYLCDIRDRCSDFFQIVSNCDTTDTELEEGSNEIEPLYPQKTAGSFLAWANGATATTAKPYWERVYLQQAVKSADPLNDINVKLTIPFSLFKNTVFECDKSVLFAEVLVLKLKVASKDDIGFTSTADNEPTIGAASLANDVSFSNIYTYIAQERNASVVEALNAQVQSQSGFSLLVPYPSVFQDQRSSTNQTVSLRLNKSHGSALKKIQSVCYSTAAGKNHRYDHHNTTAGAKVSEYYQTLNNNRLTEYNVSVSDGKDWLEHRQRCKGTPIYNRDIYLHNWFIEANFINYADKESDMKTRDTNCYGGIDLSQEVRYDVNATTANATHRWISVVHGVKLMNINNQGLILA